MQLLTIQESAALLRQHPSSLRRKIRHGEIAAFRLGSGPRAPIRVSAAEIARYISAAGAPGRRCSGPSAAAAGQ